jgi:hypothetical protein
MRRLLAAGDVALTEAAKTMAKQVYDSFGRDVGGVRSKPGQPPNIDQGSLARSVGYTKSNNLKCLVGVGPVYGKYLEFGANIRAKKKALLIPLSRLAVRAYAEGNKSGRAAMAWYEAKVGLKNIVRIKRTGHLLIGHKVGGKAARIEFDWMLASRVTLKPRPFLRPAVAKAKADGSLQSVFSASMQKEMAKK